MNLLEKKGKYVVVVFLLIFLFTALNLFLVINNVLNLQQSNLWVDHTNKVVNGFEDIYLSLQTGSLGEHDYLITGNDSYLNVFQNSSIDVAKYISTLKQLTSDNPSQQSKINQLQKLTSEEYKILHQQEAMFNKNSNLTSQAKLHTEEDSTLLAIRNLINSSINYEQLLLSAREKASSSNFSIVYTTTVIGGISNLILISLAFYLITLELKRRQTIEHNKDEFISMASHELKTPITSLKLFMLVVNRKLDKGDIASAKNYISKIDAQINKLTKLITNLLDISRVQTGKMRLENELFNLDALIDETVETVSNSTDNQQIIVHGNIKRMIEGDRDRIGQVVTNLLTNAIKYSPKRGDIIVETTSKNDAAVVSIQDNGIGIDKKHHEKIFERLYQVTDPEEKTYPGLGIGLYVCRQIIDLHKGKIWMTSEKGKGSTFYFSLPFSDKEGIMGEIYEQ